jgi:hypothetical protein
VDGTVIADNQVMNGGYVGIAIEANYSSAGSNTSITNTTITDNEILENGSIGIRASSFGDNNTITGVAIDRNMVSGNTIGIAVMGGENGADGSSVNS